MSTRHLARSIVLQTLFELDFEEKDQAEVSTILSRNAAEFAPGLGDITFMERLLKGVLEKQKDLDTVIEKAAPDWPLEKISPIDRNVLRLGLYELLFGDRNEVPTKVAINEAIELAKTFGGDSSGKFINGVLGSVYKEMGEPGRFEHSKKRSRPHSGEIPREDLAGAVIYTRYNNEIYVALVHDVFGHWTLSKGKVEPGKSPQEGVVEEIKEELGIDITVKEELGINEYIASHPERGKICKHVTYFLAETAFGELKLGSSGGLDDARWFKLSEIVSLNIYDDILPIITKAINLLLQRK